MVTNLPCWATGFGAAAADTSRFEPQNAALGRLHHRLAQAVTWRMMVYGFQEKRMRMLVLGGTAWLGRHIVDSALAGGHEVTCLARGESGAMPSGARWVRADRDREHANASVAQERWDSIIDLSRQPGQVRRAAAALAGTCGSFVFVSSTSVYADHRNLNQDEGADVLPALESDVMQSMAFYGPAKVACEQHVRNLVGAR